MDRDPSDTSVLTFSGDVDRGCCAVLSRADAGAEAADSTSGGTEVAVRYQVTSGDEAYLVEVHWPKDTGITGARVTGLGELPKGWEAEFWFSDETPLGWLVLNVPLDAKVEVV